jgi:hypothetical protein
MSTTLASAFPDSVAVKRTHPSGRKNEFQFSSRYLAAPFSSGGIQDPLLGKTIAPDREHRAVFGVDKSSLQAPSGLNSIAAGWVPEHIERLNPR